VTTTPRVAAEQPELQDDQAVRSGDYGAQAATTAGTKVYSVAYGAASSGCSSGDTHNPCTTMQAIASDSSLFYSTSSTCKITGSANTVTQLPSIFQAITTTLTKRGCWRTRTSGPKSCGIGCDRPPYFDILPAQTKRRGVLRSE